MATFNSKNYALVTAVPSQKVPPFEQKGNTYIAYDEITMPQAVIALNDIIETALIVPKGAIIVDAIILSPSLGTTGIFSLGTVTDADALIVAADAGGQAVKASAPAGAADLGKKVTVDTRYRLTCTEATTAANGLKLQVMIEFAYIGG